MSWLDYGYPNLNLIDKRKAIAACVCAYDERKNGYYTENRRSIGSLLDALELIDTTIDLYDWLTPETVIISGITWNDVTRITTDYLNGKNISQQHYKRDYNAVRQSDIPTREYLLNEYNFLNLLYKKRLNSVVQGGGMSSSHYSVYAAPPFGGEITCKVHYCINYQTSIDSPRYSILGEKEIAFNGENVLLEEFDCWAGPENVVGYYDFSNCFKFIDIDA